MHIFIEAKVHENVMNDAWMSTRVEYPLPGERWRKLQVLRQILYGDLNVIVIRLKSEHWAER